MHGFVVPVVNAKCQSRLGFKVQGLGFIRFRVDSSMFRALEHKVGFGGSAGGGAANRAANSISGGVLPFLSFV